MLRFVKTAFAEFFEIILWINLIGCVILGAIIFGNVGDKENYMFLGLIAGAFFGIITNIVLGGFIATFINIDKNIEKIVNNSKNASLIKKSKDDDSASSALIENLTNTSEGGTPIKSGQTLQGNLNSENKRDVYMVALTQPGRLSINVINDDEVGLPDWHSYVNVFDANGTEINVSGRFQFPYNYGVDLKYAGTYYVEVKSSKHGMYQLTVHY